jgi:putative DNA primase/helicase
VAISEWSEELQRLIIGLALRGDLLAQMPEALQPELFGGSARGPQSPRQRIASAIGESFTKYGSVTPEVIGDDVRRAAARLGPEERGAIEREWREILEVPVPADPRSVYDRIGEGVDRRALERALLEGAGLLSDGRSDTAAVRELLARATARQIRGAGAAVVRRFDEIQEEAVDWLWANHIARGSLTIISGDPGLGKSKVTMDLAARHSRGNPWPDDQPGGAPGSTIVLTAEDHPGYTIKPRLKAMGADQSRLYLLEAIREAGGERQLSLDTDLGELGQLVADTGADLVVIDPLSAYLGRVDSWKDGDLRRVLGPVAKLAERSRVAIVAVMHLTKSQDRKALMRLQGSVGFGAAARTVFGVVPDQDLDGRRVFAALKMNLGPRPAALAFNPNLGLGLTWETTPIAASESEVEAMFQPRRRSMPQREEAKDFLRQMLGDGPKAAAEVVRRAEAVGISQSTLRRVRETLDVIVERQGFGGAVRWKLPANADVSKDEQT